MKRFLSLMVTLTLVFMLFALAAPKVAAAAPVSTCTTDSTVFVHYHRWDDTYTGTTIWTWGYGTDGSGDGTGVFSNDSFGAVYQICVNSADADAELGLIMKYGDAWGDGMNDRDGVDTDENGTLDGNHKLVTIRDGEGDLLGFDENGEMHIYVFEGSNQVNYTDDPNSLPYSEDLATMAIVYYDPEESYEGWGIWTWNTGTNGTVVGDWGLAEFLEFTSGLGVDGGIVENIRVAFINVDTTDMGEDIGFFVRDEEGNKKSSGDILISTTGFAAGDFVTYFYIAGASDVLSSFEEFYNVLRPLEISTVKPLDPNSIEVVFNKPITTSLEGVDLFDETQFALEDKDGNVVIIDYASYVSTKETNQTFTLILLDELSGSKSPYTLSYTIVDEDDRVTELEFSVDSLAPIITIIGSQDVELELGDLYSLPTYSASDKVTAEDTEAVVLYSVKVKDGHGTVDTRYAGIYDVVIVAEDKFGNVTEKTITVTVKDPCDETAHLDANNFNAELIALLIGIPLAIGAIITLRRGY